MAPRARHLARLACLALLLPACTAAPKGRFTAASRADPACAAAARAALEAFPRDLGLDLTITDDDVQTLLETDALERGYARDAAQFTVELGLDVEDGGACRLRLWSMTERRPGSTSTRMGDFGSAPLAACRCE